MILSTVLTPLNDVNLRLAAQCGVEGVVVRYPGPELQDLLDVCDRLRAFGLRAVAIEGGLPIEQIKLGQDRDGRELAAMATLLRHMEAADVPLLCYNFMCGSDWVRTRSDAPARGGARVTAFDLQDAVRAVSMDAGRRLQAEETVSSEQLWRRLSAFLEQLLPLAERAGVALAMHPDDPPLPSFLGRARIMSSVEAFEKLLRFSASPSNAICFCQGTFAAMRADIPGTIRRFGRRIKYVHFRDVRGGPESFVETFHDDGPTDMAAAIAAMRASGFDGPIRPDHVPQLAGEEHGEPGYTMLGRLFAFGYIRGLLDALPPACD